MTILVYRNVIMLVIAIGYLLKRNNLYLNLH
ncbi:Uncharacterised protein [Shewanella baltica]|nr:hypothetical protein Sbal117_3059 [Shewanella baltica OS117]EHQ15751.1 hypothetical protein Sbal183_2865 [Shewanella baltica OS183]VEF25328.1 Uncharacterised protein [Shewanella baltica]